MTKGFLERANTEDNDYIVYIPLVPIAKEDEAWCTCVLSFDGPLQSVKLDMLSNDNDYKTNQYGNCVVGYYRLNERGHPVCRFVAQIDDDIAVSGQRYATMDRCFKNTL